MIFHDFLGDVEAQASAALGLLSCEIRIEDSGKLRRLDSSPGVFDAKIDIEILLRANNRDLSLFLGGSLDCIDDHVLDGTTDLQRIAQKRARVLANGSIKLNATLGRHRGNSFEDFAENTGN